MLLNAARSCTKLSGHLQRTHRHIANVLFDRVAALRAVVSYDLGWELMLF